MINASLCWIWTLSSAAVVSNWRIFLLNNDGSRFVLVKIPDAQVLKRHSEDFLLFSPSILSSHSKNENFNLLESHFRNQCKIPFESNRNLSSRSSSPYSYSICTERYEMTSYSLDPCQCAMKQLQKHLRVIDLAWSSLVYIASLFFSFEAFC